jgi:hypothetical protein
VITRATFASAAMGSTVALAVSGFCGYDDLTFPRWRLY